MLLLTQSASFNCAPTEFFSDGFHRAINLLPGLIAFFDPVEKSQLYRLTRRFKSRGADTDKSYFLSQPIVIQ